MKITFEELQVGDRVKVTYTQGSVACMRTGKVSAKSKFEVLAEPHAVLANRIWDNLVIKLIERPLPTTPGTVFRATEIRGKDCDVVMFVGLSRLYSTNVFYVSATPIGGMCDFDASDITAWEPIN